MSAPTSAVYARHRADIAAMLPEDRWPIAWLDDQVAVAGATVIGDDDGCVIVMLRRYPGGLVEVHGLAAVGPLSRVLALITEAEAWGRHHGASIASIASRSGWARVLAGSGYVEIQRTIEKVLT